MYVNLFFMTVFSRVLMHGLFCFWFFLYVCLYRIILTILFFHIDEHHAGRAILFGWKW